jgi:hypothetical protein
MKHTAPHRAIAHTMRPCPTFTIAEAIIYCEDKMIAAIDKDQAVRDGVRSLVKMGALVRTGRGCYRWATLAERMAFRPKK